jgi:hypothetical protein
VLKSKAPFEWSINYNIWITKNFYHFLAQTKFLGYFGQNWIVNKKWNSVPEFHWNIFLFSGIWNYLKGGISGKMPKKWNFGPFFFRNIPKFFFFFKKKFFFSLLYSRNFSKKKKILTEKKSF